MTVCERKITKEQYKRAIENRGYISKEDMPLVFSQSELLGYGIYNARVFERDGDFYVRYHIGSSCD